MKALKILLALLVSGLTPVSFAGTGSGTINQIYVHSPNSGYSSAVEGLVFFTTAQHLSPPPCSGVQWAFSLDNVRGRMMYALLLSAKAQGKSVTVYGDGTCTDWSDRERPYYLLLE